MVSKSFKKRIIFIAYVIITIGLMGYSFYLRSVSGLSHLAITLIVSGFFVSTFSVMTILYYVRKNEMDQTTAEFGKFRADVRKLMLWCGLLFLLCICGIIALIFLKGPLI
jgi:hypothetical protein